MVASEKLPLFGLQRNVMEVWDLRWFQNRPFVEIGIRTNFARGTLESWALEFGIQLKESGISRLESRIQVPMTNTGIQHLESGIHGVP